MTTLVEGDPKVPLSIATTLRCRGGHYSIPWIAPLYSGSILYNAECYARQHQVPFFESLVWLNLGLNPGLPNHWQKTLGQWRPDCLENQNHKSSVLPWPKVGNLPLKSNMRPSKPSSAAFYCLVKRSIKIIYLKLQKLIS